MIALIMAGGSGTRFWPLSRESKPKQYQKLFDNKSMLQNTVERLYPLIGPKNIYIVSTESQLKLIRDDVPQIPVENIIIEPVGRNTAPCIAYSAMYLKNLYPADETMIVLPSDHIIIEQDVFIKSINLAKVAAKKGYLVTFGIKPDYPATGYGYIEAGDSIDDNIKHITQFKEKPDYKTAKSFIEAGNYFWNSGMFMWTIETITQSFLKHAPDIFYGVEEIVKLRGDFERSERMREIYANLPKLPVDIAIMEKSDSGVVIPVNYHWNDVGSWRSVAELSEKDENNNTFFSKNISINSGGNYIHTGKFVALIDIDDIVLVETENAILIAKKESVEKVKDIVNKLSEKKMEEYL